MSSPQVQEIIKFIKGSYDQNGRIPSLRDIIKQFQKEGLSFTGFYKLFPLGLAEACRLAGVPIPSDRIEKTSEAHAAKEKDKLDVTTERALNCLTLTEDQTKRLFGMSHLEDGEDPLLIVDELLDRDSFIRKQFNLSLLDTKRVAEFLKKAVDGGWSVSAQPNIIECVTNLHNCGIQNLSSETVNGLIQILKDLKTHKLDPTQFVAEASQVQSGIYLLRQYRAGYITLQDFKQKVAVFQ